MMRTMILISLCISALAFAQNKKPLPVDTNIFAPEQLSDLWLNSIELFLAENENLTEKQTNLLWAALEFGSTDNFSAVNQKKPSFNHLKSLVDKINEAFSKDQRGAIFSEMGIVQNWMLRAAVVSQDVIACSCTIGGGACPGGFGCSSGCYTWGTGAWNGLCRMETQSQISSQ